MYFMIILYQSAAIRANQFDWVTYWMQSIRRQLLFRLHFSVSFAVALHLEGSIFPSLSHSRSHTHSFIYALANFSQFLMKWRIVKLHDLFHNFIKTSITSPFVCLHFGCFGSWEECARASAYCFVNLSLFCAIAWYSLLILHHWFSSIIPFHTHTHSHTERDHASPITHNRTIVQTNKTHTKAKSPCAPWLRSSEN